MLLGLAAARDRVTRKADGETRPRALLATHLYCGAVQVCDGRYGDGADDLVHGNSLARDVHLPALVAREQQ